MTKDECKKMDIELDKNLDQVDQQIKDLENFLCFEHMKKQTDNKTPEIASR